MTLKAGLWLGLFTNISILYDFYDGVMSIAVEQVKKIVDLQDSVARPVNIRSTCSREPFYGCAYCPDNYVRYVDPLAMAIGAWNNVWMLPNETWINECGDCDDLALFVYAILKATARPDEEIYLMDSNRDILRRRNGHTGVMVVAEADERRDIIL